MPRIALVAIISSLALRADSLLPPLTPAQAVEANKVLQSFKTNPKGPFLQIRWFCKDGSTHPAPGTPCKERGGGIQHAIVNAETKKLAGWNIDTGTIFAAIPFDAFFDEKRAHHRLRELTLEQYLRQVDEGWVDRRAFSYRGSRQSEDETAAGRELLIRLLSKPSWTARNYYLALQTVAAVPHGVEDSLLRRIRALALEVAENDSHFQTLRAKIHAAPSADDLDRVKEFQPSAAAIGAWKELVAAMEKARDSQKLVQAVPVLAKRFAGSPVGDDAKRLEQALPLGNETEILTIASTLARDIRKVIESSTDGKRNLELADFLAMLSDYVFEHPPRRKVSRQEALDRAHLWAGLAAGTGLLSHRELDAFDAEWMAVKRQNRLPAATYLARIRYLARTTEWSRATVAREFQPTVDHLTPAEPEAAHLVDHLLRSSAALPLSRELDILSADAQRAAGIRHSFFGEPVSASVMALNPGVAIASLASWSEGHNGSALDPSKIYIIPETAADLTPVAGILSLDSGNALSHTQLLAANAGIPNANIPSTLLPTLGPFEGREIFYAVSPGGTVILRDVAGVPAAEMRIWRKEEAPRGRVKLNTSKLRLGDRRIRTLEEISSEDVGVLCGPKAGNLGQLKRYFPQAVAQGLVIPFGAYASHFQGKFQNDVATAFGEADRRRAAGASPLDIRRWIAPKLAEFRNRIEAMPLDPSFEKELVTKMGEAFGEDGTYGVFVRSDTNAEDLPEFSGAGLNRTVANVVGSKNVLQALREVWASPFADRAYEWRSRILESTDAIYPSVVLLRTVPVDKSGVIATMNLETGNTGATTVNTSEGIAAVVDGGVAESLLLLPDGGVRLLQQARNPYRKTVRPQGGLVNVASSGDDYVLREDEIRQVREMVADVQKRYPPEILPSGERLPWDIEFGFERGSLRLFQIRPLARFRELRTLDSLSRFDAKVAVGDVDLAGMP